MRRNNLTTCESSCIWILVVSFCFTSNAIADHPTLGLQQEGAGPTTTLTAMTLPKGAFLFGIESQYLSNNELSDFELGLHADDGVHSVESVSNISLNFAYGVSDRMTLGLNLPYLRRSGLREAAHDHEEPHHDEEHEAGVDHESVDESHELDATEYEEDFPEIVDLGDSSGLGDLTIYAQYRLTGDHTASISALLGIKAPTGKTNVNNNLGQRFETEHQPGTGSWDALGGLAATRQWSKTSLDGNILYSIAGDGSQSTNIGDVFNYNLALSRRFTMTGNRNSGASASSHLNMTNSWDLALELNGEWRDMVSISGEQQDNTGGNVVYLASSLRFNSRNGWNVYASVSTPVVENLNGVQSDPDFRLFVGISTSLGSSP
jgi:hypothetical protein